MDCSCSSSSLRRPSARARHAWARQCLNADETSAPPAFAGPTPRAARRASLDGPATAAACCPLLQRPPRLTWPPLVRRSRNLRVATRGQGLRGDRARCHGGPDRSSSSHTIRRIWRPIETYEMVGGDNNKRRHPYTPGSRDCLQRHRRGLAPCKFDDVQTGARHVMEELGFAVSTEEQEAIRHSGKTSCRSGGATGTRIGCHLPYDPPPPNPPAAAATAAPSAGSSQDRRRRRHLLFCTATASTATRRPLRRSRRSAVLSLIVAVRLPVSHLAAWYPGARHQLGSKVPSVWAKREPLDTR